MYRDFDWEQAPLSSHTAPLIGSGIYLAVIAVLPKLVPSGGVKGLDKILAVHNAFLSAWSLVMFLGCLWEMVMRVQASNVEWMFCEEPGLGKARGPLYFWSYIFYVSKYYEMVDTVLALLKGHPPPHFILHVYHHSLVPVLIWNWLEYRSTLQHIGLLFNTFVHVVMYAYYCMKVLKIPTPWKSWVTRLQIIQFMTSVVLLCFTLQRLRGDFFGNTCSGIMTLWVNMAFNMTLLFQFVGVLFSSAPPPRSSKKVE